MKRAIALILVMSLLILTGCECMSGLGRDIQKTGDFIEKKAEEGKKSN